jgi:hypothetical protein
MRTQYQELKEKLDLVEYQIDLFTKYEPNSTMLVNLREQKFKLIDTINNIR